MARQLLLLSYLIILPGFVISGCEKNINTKKSMDEILAADKAFSTYSEEHGFIAAFETFVHDEGSLLRPGSMPIVGRKAVIDYVSKANDKNVTLTWEPLKAEVSGDLGYTYGTFKAVAGNHISEGTYVTIWKKDKEGNWKYVLDSGNDGLGN